MGPYEFTCRRVDVPTLDPRVPDQGSGTRNRYLSFEPGNDDQQKAFRMTVIRTDITPPEPGDFSCVVGEKWWADEPCEVTYADRRGKYQAQQSVTPARLE